VKLLLDSHTWLWMLAAPERLTANVRSLLADTNNQIFVSVASVWEVRIKHALGKISLPMTLEGLVAVSKLKWSPQIRPCAKVRFAPEPNNHGATHHEKATKETQLGVQSSSCA
jgi:PIN domain nuclease of toxin-antitoxin system